MIGIAWKEFVDFHLTYFGESLLHIGKDDYYMYALVIP